MERFLRYLRYKLLSPTKKKKYPRAEFLHVHTRNRGRKRFFRLKIRNLRNSTYHDHYQCINIYSRKNDKNNQDVYVHIRPRHVHSYTAMYLKIRELRVEGYIYTYKYRPKCRVRKYKRGTMYLKYKKSYGKLSFERIDKKPVKDNYLSLYIEDRNNRLRIRCKKG